MVASTSKGSAVGGKPSGLNENSPLIPKSPSTSFAPVDEIIDRGDTYSTYSDGEEVDKGREVEIYKPGKSSFSQTVCTIFFITRSTWPWPLRGMDHGISGLSAN